MKKGLPKQELHGSNQQGLNVKLKSEKKMKKTYHACHRGNERGSEMNDGNQPSGF
jgi:hypothetical protein